MDFGSRQRLDLLNAKSNALASALCSISESSDVARQKCLNFATEIRELVKAWSNLSKALYDPALEARPAFTKILERVLVDNSKIIDDVRNQLAELRAKQAQYDAAIKGKRWIPRAKTSHLVVSFLSRETIQLRQQQVYYAISVLDVLLGVVFHAKTLGEGTDTQDAQASLQDQLARLRNESDARALVFREERRLGDKSIMAHLWLSTVTWHSDSFDVPPFETLALQWLKIASGTVVEQAETSGEHNPRQLTKLVMQLQQDIREQASQHKVQVNEHKRQHDSLRAWAEGTIGQLEFSQQKSAKDSASRIEEMKAQLEVQKQRIDSDNIVIEQLKHSRHEWSTHYQKQSQLLQQIETQMREIKKENALLKRSSMEQQQHLLQLQDKYEKLQQAASKLQQQNQLLKEKLTETNVEKQDLETRHSQLQARYAKAVQHNKKWREMFQNGPEEREAQIEQLQEEVKDFKDEINALKSDLAYMTGDRNSLRDSLKKAESERLTERNYTNRLQERLATKRTDCPSSYETRHSGRRSRSRQRSDSSTQSASRSVSKESNSRASSSTFVDDSASDRDYYIDKLPRRTSGDATSKLSGWFSPRRTFVLSNR